MTDEISYFRRTVVRQILIFLFCVSGLSTSMAVIIWIRLFKLVLGNTIFVTNAVIITLLCGFAFGNYFFGKKIDQNKQELQKFLWFELILGIYTIFLLIILPSIPPLHKFINLQIKGQYILIHIFKFVITFLLLITPATLIGATFPVLNRFFIQSSNRVIREISNLFSVHLFGAVIGCFVTGFILLQIFSLKQILLFSSFLNILIATIVRFLLKKIEPTSQLETEFYNQKLKHFEPITSTLPQFLIRTAIIGLGVSGFLSLSYLILWIRSLVYIISNDTFAIYIIVTVFIAGLSLGSLLYSRLLQEQMYLLPMFAIFEIIIGLLGLISIILLPQLLPLNEILGLSPKTAIAWNWRIIYYFCNVMVILLLPAIFMGASIPLVGKIYLTNFEARGQKIGTIYTAKILGAILGLDITSFLLIPHIGLQKSIIFLILINFLIGLIILLLYTLQYGKITRISLIFGMVASIFCFCLLIPSDLISEIFERAKKGYKLVYAKEGLNTTVTIHENLAQHYTAIAFNGVTAAETIIDWATVQRLYGHLPLFLHEHPDTILVIGFGSGETIRSILSHQVEQVDCTENSSEIVQTCSLINLNQENLISNPKLRIIRLDGNTYNIITEKKYDIIINDLIHPAIPDKGNLFTREFFMACRHNLKQGGIMSSAVPLFKISLEDFKIILNTFQSVFPFSTLWYPNNCLNRYAFLVGTVEPEFKISYKEVTEKLKNSVILMNLNQIGMDNVYEILDCFLMGPKIIKQLTGGVRIYSENSPFLEFSTSRIGDLPSIWNQNLQLLASYRESVFPYLINIDSPLEQREFVRLVLENYYQSTEFVFNALSNELMGNIEKALQIYRQVYSMNRFDHGAKRFLDAYYDSQLIPSPQAPVELVENAIVYYQKMEYEEAIHLLNKALELEPDFAPAYFALGINFEILGNYETAKRMYQKTLSLKPNSPEAKGRLDSLPLKIGN